MTPFAGWIGGGFGGEVLPLCGPRHDCTSPGKVPHIPGWRSMPVTAAMGRGWDRNHRGNIGLRTARFPAVDVDVGDPEIADACEQVILLTLGSTARRTRRNSSRCLYLYRLEGEPFEKRAITLTGPGGEAAKVEVLAAGQQVVVAGIHHSGAAIEWAGGQPRAADLAPMSRALRDDLLAALRKRLTGIGCKVAGTDEAVRRPARPFHATEKDGELAEVALGKIDPDLPYDDWVRVGMAIHSKWPGTAGLALWDAWSSRGEKYAGARELERHWASFHSDKGVGFGTLIVMARRAG